jgi:hypothetical protein
MNAIGMRMGNAKKYFNVSKKQHLTAKQLQLPNRGQRANN